MADSHFHPHPTTTVPDASTNPPSPSPNATPAPPPPRATLIRKLRILLLRSLSKTAHTTDLTLVRLDTLLSTPSGIDTLLCTTSYTLTLLSALLSKLLQRRLTTIASDIASKADGILLPGETLIAEIPASSSTKRIAQVLEGSKALAEVISDYRIFVRLWALVGLYTWARATYLEPLAQGPGRKEKFLRALTWASIASCVGSQVLEDGAYLASKGVLTGDGWAGETGKKRENKWWMMSSRLWATYVGIELVRLGVEWWYSSPDDSAAVGGKGLGDGEKEDKIEVEERRKSRKLESWHWWKDLVSNIGYAPMTLHWSLEEGLLSELGVGVCGMIAGGALLVDAWGSTV
ncbi:hypothetical protein CFE70_003149 [Pyrenophora teres f. teres 0-1]|uniref:PEX11 domain containing protein n=2 Tax=Pyrenophora teres f. teres TaxID=97479 RepID=E3RGC2_PYRTT|nr:hypothetical protein PTT_06841 [Pyrenophora teres f. teres 0-1]KAE8846382.1 hypothetical protein HRS9139_00949 [Pyrenophora teres f. teres]KAE8848522.1 hypothetical protein PTNB85_02365 [Pyrenophora teres f. teres]KAE8868447.1 hypothetical protein PTNB29_02358 [Pyrenophora teres f. teres]KAE8873214.1 hypothetical protein PTNB73_02365 [Pyrenophora teres f. teres]